MKKATFDRLEIPETLAAGPGPGNTDPRILERFGATGIADHMHPAVLRGMIESKIMLREIWGTKNTYTYAVPGTGWSGLETMFAAIRPGDKVVVFVNGTFSGIDALNVRMKAATPEELAANSTDPASQSVTIISIPHGQSVSSDIIETALSEHKPKWATMAHWETGAGRINDLQAFSDACVRHNVLGLIDAVSSLGVSHFSIDNYPGVVGWASCPQKGICCLPLTYAPVSFNDRYIAEVKKYGAPTYANHPILEARHWGIADGKDVEKVAYHRTHSAYAVAAFHEALRLLLEEGVKNRAASYIYHEQALRAAIVAMGCAVTSNMTSLVVFNLPPAFAGREAELVQNCRAENFGIWTTLSEPIQVRIGILNLLSREHITEIVNRFANALRNLGANIDEERINSALNSHYS